MGVFPPLAPYTPAPRSLPHARGGVSTGLYEDVPLYASSPRPWGCFRFVFFAKGSSTVFPTPVGVFLASAGAFRTQKRLPHARGGVSLLRKYRPKGIRSSPRPWGCFYRYHRSSVSGEVFPTPVGVFLVGIWLVISRKSLPHARGGVSGSAVGRANIARSSPRPWGCF